MGSKRLIINDLLPFIMEYKYKSNCYVEPFMGGGNSICKVSGHRIGNDLNFYLIEMWKALLNGWNPDYYSREQYYDIKNNMDKYPSHLVGYVGFNCSYCGVWFGSYAGQVNTKGGVRDYQLEAKNNILKQIPMMIGITLYNNNYDEFEIPKKSIIYCDPPYQNVSKYSTGGFNYEKFWDWCRTMSKNNFIYISEYNAPNDFIEIYSRKLRSSLRSSNNGLGVKESIEKLFIHESQVYLF